MNSGRFRRLLYIGWVVLGLAASAFAVASATLTGRIADPQGAVIPGATVEATNVDTNITTSTRSNEVGLFVIPELAPGRYRIIVRKQGFETIIKPDVVLHVEDVIALNFSMQVGSVVQTMTVEGGAPLLTTTNATLGGLVTGQQVITLPLNGRDITALVMLQPGVNIEVDQSLPLTSNPSGNNFVASNGNRGTTGSSYMDGLDTSANALGGAELTNFNLDAIAEFKVLQNNYSAEYGRGSGTIIQLVTKSGTNQFHGSAFEFLRNNVLDARNFFSDKVPPFRRNEFGGTIGGPIRKDRTFFFFQYAGFRQQLGEPILIPVPTAGERQGVVNITGSNGKPDQLLVPLNADAQTVLNRYPMPNQPNGAFGPRTFNFQFTVPQNTNQWSARVDHRFSEKDTLFARLTFSNNDRPILDPQFAVLESDFSGSLGYNERSHGFAETHIFTPTLLNTFRFAYSQAFPNWAERNLKNAAVSLTDGSLAVWGPDTADFAVANNAFIFEDSVSSTKGRNSFNVGGEYRTIWEPGTTVAFGGVAGIFLFEPGQTLPVAIPSASGLNNLAAGSPSPSSLISFMVGAPTTRFRGVALPGFPTDAQGLVLNKWRRFHLNGWFQDDIKANRKLTLNLGLRYEYNSVPYEVKGRRIGVIDDPNFEGGALFRRPVLDPKPGYFPDYNGWGPRFGLAYRLDEKTVLRGGFGAFTNLPLTQTSDQEVFGVTTGITNNPPFSLSPPPGGSVPPFVDLQGNPLPPGGNVNNIRPNTPIDLKPFLAYFGGPQLFNVVSLGFRNAYTMSGNFTLERQLPGNIALQAGYVTNNAVKLYGTNWANAYAGALPQYTPFTNANPGMGEVLFTDNFAHSTYHSLQVVARNASPNHGLQFQASYTYSKSIDNATTVFNGPIQNSGVLQNNPFCWRCEKSVSGFDFPHRLVLNFVYALPIDKWQAISLMPRRLVQGWQITSIIQMQSGFPFTVNSPFGTKQFGTDQYTGSQATRPDLVQQPTLSTGGGPEEQFFSNAVVADGKNLGQKFFATPGGLATGVQDHPGNLGRNTFRTQPFSNFDFSLIKDTKLTERATLQFRAEFFNLFNQHAFNTPTQVLSSPGFGIASSTVLSERQIQFALKLIF